MVTSIFDCPEQSHTSPTRTSVKRVTSDPSPLTSNFSPLTSNFSPLTSNFSPLTSNFSPLTSNIYGPPAFILGRSTRQRPEASAVVAYCLPHQLTRTRSPASAVPQTGMGLPRCSTMPDWNIWGITTLAPADSEAARTRNRTNSFFFISWYSFFIFSANISKKRR